MQAAELELTPDLDLLAGAVRQGGKIALGFFGQQPETWYKDGHSPVSEADMAVNACLEETLRTARPDYGWISEETADNSERLTRKRCFIVDPIDGTRAYLAGQEEWTIVAAIVEEHRPIEAAIFNPLRKELFLATAGKGVWLNGAALHVSSQEGLSGSHVAGPVHVLGEKSLKSQGLAHAGVIRSLAYRIAIVAAGRVDGCYAKSHANDWDLAAADLLVQEAGGKLTDLDGHGLLYNRENLRHPALVAAPMDLIGPLCRAIAPVVSLKKVS